MNTSFMISELEVPMIGFGPDKYYNLPVTGNISLGYRIRNKLHRNFVGLPRYVNSIAASIEIGYRLIDYSASYGDGALIAEGIKRSGIEREKIVITTRISNKAQYNNKIENEFYSQLKGLNTDYVDILMFHWPVTDYFEDTWLKMLEFREKGLCKVLGVANCNIHHLKRLYEISGENPKISQFEVHPLFSQETLRKYCRENNILVQSYSPTARQDDRLYNPRLLKNMSQKYNKSITQLILRWHTQNGMMPIIRSLNPEHLRSDFDIFDFDISDEDMDKINKLNINSRLRYDPDNCDFKSL